MVEKTLLFDSDECLGCFACEVACKQEHQLPPGENWIHIVKEEPTKAEGKWSMKFTARRCRHCGRPACREACPVGAITRRSDGIVIFSEELCMGCKACIEACPFGAPQYNAERDIVRACNLCVERIDQGLKPSCVHHCPTKALFFGNCNSYGSMEKGRAETPPL
jgi:Fe-S-cluster-containing dehydrogenase component